MGKNLVTLIVRSCYCYSPVYCYSLPINSVRIKTFRKRVGLICSQNAKWLEVGPGKGIFSSFLLEFLLKTKIGKVCSFDIQIFFCSQFHYLF